MNYSLLFKNLRREIFSGCQYKRFDGLFMAFGIVATIPFWIMTAILLCTAYVFLFVYNCVSSSCYYLESWIADLKNGVNPLTEAVIYLVAMPTLLFMRVLLSIFSIIFYTNWFMTMCGAYIASLAGIKWQPFISEVKYDEDVKITPTTNSIAAKTIILIGFVMFCITALLLLISNIEYNEVLATVTNIFITIYLLFMIISVPIAFRHTENEVSDTNAQNDSCVSANTPENDFEEEFPDF